MSALGDNSLSKDILLHCVTECERLMEERKALGEQMKELLNGAEGQGMDKRTIKEMVRMRALRKAEREERETLRQLYASSLGLLD